MRRLFHFGRSLQRRARGARVAVVGTVERLERRTLLTTYVVDTLAAGFDGTDGRISLHEALQAASGDVAFNEAPAGTDRDLVRFDSDLLLFGDATIDLAGALPLHGGGGGLLIIDGGVAGFENQITLRGGELTLDRAGATVVRDVIFEEAGDVAVGERGTGATLLERLTIVGEGRPTTSTPLGAGIVSSGGRLTVRDATIFGTSAASGGGILLADTTAVLDDVRINGATATAVNGAGGGALAARGSRVLIRDVDFGNDPEVNGNWSASRGGAVSLVDSQVVFVDSVINDNRAVAGVCVYRRDPHRRLRLA